jgi:hypothetical protein
MQEQQLTEEEVKTLTDLQNKVNGIQFDFGQLSIREAFLKKEITLIDVKKEELLAVLEQEQNPESETLKPFHEKYGDGQVDLVKKVFISSK